MGHRCVKKEKRYPWFKFNPQDWRGDAKLRLCTIGARGLWVEMLCVMHEAVPYGHLIIGGRSVSTKQMASLAGISFSDCAKYVIELELADVFSRTDDKTIFSRRMVRDKAKAEEDRNNGKAGGNPLLKGQINGGVNPPVKAETTRVLEFDDDGTRERASGRISDVAFEITGELERAFGFDLPEEIPPGWCGCAMWVQKCLDEGWQQREMVWAGKVIAKRARRSVVSYNYLEKPMAELIAEHRRPLPQVEVKQAEKLTVIANGRQQGNIIPAADRLLDKIRSFDSGPSDDHGIRDGAGEAATRLLSQG